MEDGNDKEEKEEDDGSGKAGFDMTERNRTGYCSIPINPSFSKTLAVLRRMASKLPSLAGVEKVPSEDKKKKKKGIVVIKSSRFVPVE